MKWEYLVSTAYGKNEDLIKHLNDKGAEGWELVQAVRLTPSIVNDGQFDHSLIFKRAIVEAEESQLSFAEQVMSRMPTIEELGAAAAETFDGTKQVANMALQWLQHLKLNTKQEKKG